MFLTKRTTNIQIKTIGRTVMTNALVPRAIKHNLLTATQIVTITEHVVIKKMPATLLPKWWHKSFRPKLEYC